jgi:hypothetical protein
LSKNDGNNIHKAIGSLSYSLMDMNGTWMAIFDHFGYFRGFQTHSMVNGVSTERFGCSFALLICAMDPEAVEPTWSGSCSSKHKETNRATRLVVLHFGPPSPPRENWGFIPVYKQFIGHLDWAQGGKDTQLGPSAKDCYPHLIPSCYGSTLDFFTLTSSFN